MDEAPEMRAAIRVFVALVSVLIGAGEAYASDQPARWDNWRLGIDKRSCHLSRMFLSGNPGGREELAFLSGTHFRTMMFQYIAKTSYRDADQFRLGETILGVKIWSDAKIPSNEQLASLRIGEFVKEAAETAKRPANNTSKASSSFWLYGAQADELLHLMARGDPIELVFKDASGEAVIETVYTSQSRDRFPAWAEAFRACTVANRD